MSCFAILTFDLEHDPSRVIYFEIREDLARIGLTPFYDQGDGHVVPLPHNIYIGLIEGGPPQSISWDFSQKIRTIFQGRNVNGPFFVSLSSASSNVSFDDQGTAYPFDTP